MQIGERDIIADSRQPVDEAEIAELRLHGIRASRCESTDGGKAGNHLADYLSV